MRQEISTGSAPEALGPYSQAVRAGQFLFLSGQVPIDPATGELVQGGTGPQTHQVLKNITAVLSAANISLDHVVRTTVFLLDMNDFTEMNDVYKKYCVIIWEFVSKFLYAQIRITFIKRLFCQLFNLESENIIK